ncbi:MAG: circadian clock KaiB family protein [Ginsengibacter sp.]|jgi:circadian clock protein KaiB
MTEKHIPDNDDWEHLDESLHYRLKLFITGASPNSARAIANLKTICEKYLGKKYELEIIDVYQQPIIAKREQVVALPMLIKYFPLPVKKLFGDMSNSKTVLKGLGVNSI